MIVPRTKLLVWVTVVGIPAAVLGVIGPEMSPVMLLLGGGLLLVALIDALRARQTLSGISVQSTALVRMQKAKEGFFPVEFRNGTGKAKRLVLGVVFPAALGAMDEELAVMLPAESLPSQLSLRCKPSRRGSYVVKGSIMEACSPMGFWSYRQSALLGTEVRVYPNLMDERKKLSALFLARGHYGLRAQRQTGKGRDFEKVRDYIAGDPMEDIHWKASAKRGRPVTKVFQIEQKQEVYVVLDASRLSAVRGADGETVFERFVTCALMLALATRQQGDSFGLAAFSNRLLTFVHAQNGRNHFQVCRDMLYALEPASVAPDFEEIGATIRLRLRKRALVIFLTSLADAGTAEAFTKSVPPLCRQHLLVVNTIRPPAVAPIFSSGLPSGSVDQIYIKLGGHLVWHQLRELQKQLHHQGVTLSMLDHERFALDTVTQYIELKARQVL